MAKQILIPEHIAIIMDGNGRWAKNRHQLRIIGHRAGLKAVKKTVQHAKKIGVKALTLYAFSCENWKRPEHEVSSLMSLFLYALTKEAEHLHKNNIRLNIIGDVSHFSTQLQSMIREIEDLTHENSGLILNVAANYGGRWDITRAVKNIVRKVESNVLSVDDINEDVVNNEILLNEQPVIDLLIRTGGECRISNFLMWQIAYSELYFTDVLWPDFDRDLLDQAILAFNKRERRFGQIIDA